MERSDRRGGQAVVALTGVLLALNLVHVIDHVRQGRSLDLELYGVGTLSVIAAIATIALGLIGSRWAEPAAILLGVATIVGLAGIHVAPTWWPLSDSYGDAGVDALSWSIILAMIVAGAALAIKVIRLRTDRS